ncbi:MAG: isoprenylcysteine carboxylmethyltransferase family protein [Acidobacteria bacterium]|jgi:protein-S-isoprenylcysteine O-methyltransferase Ste14|nr:isoprenylcysteine carboxylmethyltransferase family protein [Acidobacteriota bacterium]
MLKLLARFRVTLGFIVGGVCFWLADPSWRTLALGGLIAVPGESLRLWAAGHIEKGREITRSGPYQFVRHPLYLGSAIMAIGFAVAAGSPVVVALVATYMGLTLLAATRTEERHLDEKFEGEYSAYREGRATPVARKFSWQRVVSNREYRAATGLVIGLGVLAVKMALFNR